MAQESANGSAVVLALRRHYEAAVEMLRRAIRDCPDELWDARDEGKPFWQKAYHILYCFDVFLNDRPDTFEAPPFHTPGAHVLARTPSHSFSREQVEGYLEKAAAKCAKVFDGLTLEGLGRECEHRRYATVADMLFDNLRHTQHHIGVMYSDLRRKTGDAPDWFP